MTTVRAKMVVIGITDDQENKNVALMAVSEGSEENKSFSKYTPSAHLSINISKETPASDFFENGKEYYLDFTVAE